MVNLSIKGDKKNAKVMIDGHEIKVFGLQLNMEVGEPHTVTLRTYVDQLDIDAEVLAKLVDVKEDEQCS